MQLDDVYVTGVGAHIPGTMTVTEAIKQGLYSEEEAQESGRIAVAVAPHDLPAEHMATWAAEDALTLAGRSQQDAVTPGVLVHAIVNDAGCDGWIAAQYIQKRLKILDCHAVEVRSGCNGIAPMHLACLVLRGGGYASALVTAADVWQPPRVDRWRGASGFAHADGASALALGRERGIARVLSVHTQGDPALEGLTRGAHPLYGPHSDTLNLRQRAKEFFREMPYEEVWRRKDAGLASTVTQALDEAGVRLHEVAHVVTTHLDGPLLHDEILKPLGLMIERTTWQYGRAVGHLGAGDQFAGLNHLIRSGLARTGEHVLMIGVGAGYSWGATVLEVTGGSGERRGA